MLDEEMNDKLAEYSTKFETEKKEKDLLTEREKNLSQELQLKEQLFRKRIFLGLRIISLLFALILINRYRLKRRVALELHEKNILIDKAKNRAEESERFKQQFLANMSHEMCTPDSVISGFTSLLREKQLDDTSSKYVEAIDHSAKNLVSLVNDILDLAKMEKGKMSMQKESFSLRTELKMLVESFLPIAKKKGISIQINIADEVHDDFLGDARRISQILYNFISNAINYMDRGSVKVAVTNANTESHNKNK